MNTNLNMQTMPIDRLKPAKYNPRKDLKPGDPAYEKIKRSLHCRDQGFNSPDRRQCEALERRRARLCVIRPGCVIQIVLQFVSYLCIMEQEGGTYV